MTKSSQISAHISEGTRDLLERYVRRTGVKKGFLVEQALRHHLLALEDIPSEYIIPPRIVVSVDVFEDLLQPVKPTEALRELMRDSDGD